jgi:hypothetical protein
MLHTTRFKIKKNLYFDNQMCFCVFVRISEQTVILALFKFNWLVFVTESETVYCAVRTGSLNKADYISSLKVKYRTTSYRPACNVMGNDSNKAIGEQTMRICNQSLYAS